MSHLLLEGVELRSRHFCQIVRRVPVQAYAHSHVIPVFQQHRVHPRVLRLPLGACAFVYPLHLLAIQHIPQLVARSVPNRGQEGSTLARE